MKKSTVVMLCIFVMVLGCIAGCSGKHVKTYTDRVERVDQDLSQGNRGYFVGAPPPVDESKRKKTRGIYTVEVDLPPYYEGEETVAGSDTSRAPAYEPRMTVEAEEIEFAEIESEEPSYKEYVVQKDDTLQKISMKFYGTSKKWKKIFEANKDRLKSPDKIYPGKSLRIPSL